MSSLAFDKQGKPFSFQRRTKKLLVRLFRNPSARGTCCQVMNAEGQPLYIDPETDYVEFRKAVGHVPGLYRLDQCDENGVELDEAQAAYVAIHIARNASSSVADGSGASDVNPLVIIEHLVAIQADAMKTMAAQHAAVMAATAEILRAPYRPAPPAPPAPRNAQPDDEGDAYEYDDEEEQPVVVESPWAPIIEKALPMFQTIGGIGMVLLQQKLLPGTAIAMPGMPGMAMPNVPVAPAAPAAVAHAPVTVAAPPSVAAAAVTRTTSSTPAAVQQPAPVAVPPSVTSDDEGTSSACHEIASDEIDNPATETSTALVTTAPQDMSAVSPTVLAAPAVLAAPLPLAQQYAHLLAIRARLLPDESAFAEAVIARMEPAHRAQWIAALSAMSIDEATTSIRTTIAQIRAQQP